MTDDEYLESCARVGEELLDWYFNKFPPMRQWRREVLQKNPIDDVILKVTWEKKDDTG